MLKVRAKHTSMTGGESDDPTVFVVAEVFEDTVNQVVAETVLHYSLVGLRGKTAKQKQDRVAADAIAWAKTVKQNAAEAAPILTLLGVSADIPDA